MANVRVFELAKERGLDVNTVVAFMQSLGAHGGATTSLSPAIERRLRAALVGVKSGDRPVPKPARQQAAPERARPHFAAKPRPNLRQAHSAAVLATVPELYAMLRDSGVTAPESPVVIFHDPSAPRSARYGVRTIADATWRPATQFDARRLVEPLHEIDRWYHERDRTPPAVFIAIDLRTGHAWNGHSFEAIQKSIAGPHFDAVTFAPIPLAGEGLPPRLSPRAEL